MNLLSTGRNITIIALLLSLLFHVSSVLYIFIQKTQPNLISKAEQDHLNKIIEQQQEQKRNKPWVETQARAGNFGAPVFFEDTLPDQEDLPQEEPVSHTHENDQENTQATQDVIDEKIKNKQDIASKTEEEAAAKTEYVKNEIVVQETTKTRQKPALERKRKPPSKKKSQKPAHTQKQLPSLAQLTQGFLNQRKEQSGNYNISMIGMKRGIPSDEQMKYERYLQKLSWCLQNSFKIHNHKEPRVSNITTPHIFFVLNRDGTLAQISLKKSSGNLYVDQYVLFVFRDASESFPPIPSYLTDDPFSMTCVIY